MKRYISAALIIVLAYMLCANRGAEKPDIFQPGSSIGISKGQAIGIVVEWLQWPR